MLSDATALDRIDEDEKAIEMDATKSVLTGFLEVAVYCTYSNRPSFDEILAIIQLSNTFNCGLVKRLLSSQLERNVQRTRIGNLRLRFSP